MALRGGVSPRATCRSTPLTASTSCTPARTCSKDRLVARPELVPRTMSSRGPRVCQCLLLACSAEISFLHLRMVSVMALASRASRQ